MVTNTTHLERLSSKVPKPTEEFALEKCPAYGVSPEGKKRVAEDDAEN